MFRRAGIPDRVPPGDNRPTTQFEERLWPGRGPEMRGIRMLRVSSGWAASLILICPLSAFAAPPDDLLTVAEKSGFRATARHAEVVDLCERLARSSPLVRPIELGKSGEGRSLPLLIVADPPVSTPAEAKASGKLVVFLLGNIHAGEVCGKEALPMLVRDLIARPDHPLLKHLILAVAPIYNADGNERVSKDNRPGQVGPEEGMGRRANAAGLDLNRDFMKLEAPETRALVRFLTEWDPHLTIDTHTTNGSHHRYTITYEGPKNPAGDPRLIAFSRSRLFPEAGGSLERRSGYRSFFYGNFEDDHTRWTSFPATPRFGTTYIGLRDRLSVLSEAYSYAPFKDRVLATRDFCLALLEFADGHRDEIRILLDDARRRTIAAGLEPGDRVAIRSKPRAFPGKVDVLGFVEREVGGKRVATAQPRDYPCAIEQDFAADLEVSRPFAYLIPPGSGRVVETLLAHGIRVESLKEEVRLGVEVETVTDFARDVRPSEGHRMIRVNDSRVARRDRTFPAGTLVVRTAQPLGSLAVYLLEARSDDGLLAWNFLDDALAPGRESDHPIARMARPVEIATVPLERGS